jgi:hypothetical protein
MVLLHLSFHILFLIASTFRSSTMTSIKLAILLGTLTSVVYAHGTVSGIIVNGT